MGIVNTTGFIGLLVTMMGSASALAQQTHSTEWLSTPLADLPTSGKIGFQGKHGGAPIWFRNIRIRELE